MAIADKLARTDPSNVRLQRDLSVSLNKLGDLAQRTGDVEAETLWRQRAKNQTDGFLALRIGDLDHYRHQLQSCALPLPSDLPSPILPGTWDGMPPGEIFELLLRQGRAAAFQTREAWLQTFHPFAGRQHQMVSQPSVVVYELVEERGPDGAWQIVTIVEGPFGFAHLDGDSRVAGATLQATSNEITKNADVLERALLFFRGTAFGDDGLTVWPISDPDNIPWACVSACNWGPPDPVIGA